MIVKLKDVQATADAMASRDIAQILHINDELALDVDDLMVSLGNIYILSWMGDRFKACGNLIVLYDTPKSTESIDIAVDIEGSFTCDETIIEKILSDYHPRERIEDHYGRLRRCAV